MSLQHRSEVPARLLWNGEAVTSDRFARARRLAAAAALLLACGGRIEDPPENATPDELPPGAPGEGAASGPSAASDPAADERPPENLAPGAAPMMAMKPDAAPSDARRADAGAPMTPAPNTPKPSLEATIIALAKPAVGYSYFWGHGSWRDDGTDHGSCSGGGCPSCSHSGRYGADCSGFVAKVWQIPSPSPITTDRHPYSTYNFANQQTHWKRIPRADIKAADALVYNQNGAGHIFLVESAKDPWGSLWTYEARACATGIVHNLRTAASNYIAIRHENL